MTDAIDPSSSTAWDRMADLFERAQSLPPESRTAFLESACADDRALRTEMQALLDAVTDAPQYLEAFAAHTLGPAMRAAATELVVRAPRGVRSDSTHSREGSRVRHYDVLDSIGQGGMGVVHRGRDTRLGRDVAMKFLPPEQFTDPAARQRLVREAQAVSALDDPHVCAMHAIEETDDGGLCLVMGYCAAGTLRDRLRAGPMPVHDVIRWATQVATGLAAAHRRHIIHGDLKLANIGVTELDDARILDFGVAIRVGDDDTVEHRAAVGFVGTVPYAAPELLRGGTPDVHTDLWALGVMLYEMLSGRRPFTGATEAAVLFAILDQSPAPLTRADGAEIPAALTALVHALLAKDPAQRPPSAAVVAEQLRALRDPPSNTRTTSAVPDIEAPPRARAGVRRRVTVVAALAVFAVGAVAVRAITADREPAVVGETPTAQPLPTLAVLPFSVRGDRDLDYLAQGMVDLLTPAFDATGLVRGIDPNAVLGAASQNAADLLDSASAHGIARQVGAARYVVGSVVQVGTRITLRATLYRASGAEDQRASIVVDDREQLFDGVESLVRTLVAAELRAPGDTVAALAAATTTSTRALRAYLDGERELRDARPAAAVAHFQTAVAADSMFALAWYRLARAARWSEVDSLNAEATQRAFVLSASLPLRVQQIVRGYHALRFGAPADAERQFRQITVDYPSDVEGWMLLGETLFENNPFVGRASSEAASAFQRVMALEPRNREVTVYLMDLAARATQHGLLDTLYSMYFSPNSAGEQPGIRETYIALHARRVRGQFRTIDDPVSAHIALRRAGSQSGDLDAARRYAEVLLDPTVSSPRRVDGLLALASLDLARDRPSAAARHWREAAILDPFASLMHRAVSMAAPAIAVTDDSLRAVRELLSNARPDSTQSALSAAERSSLRHYLVGLLSLRLGDTLAVEQAQRVLAQVRAPDRLATPLGYALAGHLAKARGDLRGALSAFERSDVSLPIRVRTQVPALAQYAERLARAQVLAALNRTDEAATWYDGLRDGPAVWGAPYLVRLPE
jgi:tetratricopeptide (TPR) repeat protein